MEPIRSKPYYSFIFVCQEGELEIKAALLAASLKANMQTPYELIAAFPQPESTWGTVTPSTIKLLRDMGVRCLSVNNPIGAVYPIGNKLPCLSLPCRGEYKVFLDSDILCLKNIEPFAENFPSLALKPGDFNNAGLTREDWHEIYQHFECDPLTIPVVSTVSNEVMEPYFNAGVIFSRDGDVFSETWQEIACELVNGEMRNSGLGIHLDQITLPVTISKLSLEVEYLTNHYNHPVHLQPLESNDLPALAHYHFPDVIVRELPLLKLVKQLFDSNPGLSELVSKNEEWRSVELKSRKNTLPFNRTKNTKAEQYRNIVDMPIDIVITGIPRSGTSYLCSLMDQLDDVVAINEPKEIFHALNRLDIPYAMALYYQNLRQKIFNGEQVENKLDQGQVVSDTSIKDEYCFYHPQVSKYEFVLATKNTLAYLARLPQIIEAMPNALIIGCMRHPYDTINSWKKSFTHLSEANVDRIPIGNYLDPGLTEFQRESLSTINEESNLAMKRALWWRFLALSMWNQKERIKILIYEDWTSQSAETVKELMQIASPSTKFGTSKLRNSTPRINRDQLNDQDMACIKVVCHELADRFGYEL